MGKYILFAATYMNWGMIRRDSGEWLNTKYIVYSDGTCWSVSKYDGDPISKSLLRSLPKQTRCKLQQSHREAQQPHFTRMDENAFHKLKDILKKQFDETDAVRCCDGDGWEMHHYGSSGKLLHSIRGHIYGVSALEEIEELLTSIRR